MRLVQCTAPSRNRLSLSVQSRTSFLDLVHGRTPFLSFVLFTTPQIQHVHRLKIGRLALILAHALRPRFRTLAKLSRPTRPCTPPISLFYALTVHIPERNTCFVLSGCLLIARHFERDLTEH